jgi:hypothetical protein
MVKMKPVKDAKESKNKRANSDSSSSAKTKTPKPKIDMPTFLKKIKHKIDKIKSGKKNKRYTLISCIFLCFLEKKKKILDKKEINDFIKKEITENSNKIISGHIKNKKNESDLLTQRNYYPKLYQMLVRNRCFTKVIDMESNNEQIQLNEEYIISRRHTLFRHFFGQSLCSINKKLLNTKRRHRKFEKSVSAIKSKKTKTENKINKFHKIKKNSSTKENSQHEVDSTGISSKESEVKSKEEDDLNNSNPIFPDSNKEEEKKVESVEKKLFLKQKRKSPSSIDSNENSLIMPLFADNGFSANESKKNSKYDHKKEKEKGKEKEKEGITPKASNSVEKKFNHIINKGKDFISSLNEPKFIDTLKNKDIFRKNGYALLNYKDDSIVNFLNNALKDYNKFNKYLKYFMNNNKGSNLDSKDKNNIFEKSSEIFEDLDIKNVKCSLIISRIITKLSQFILEYDFIVEVIKEIFEYDKDCIILKNMISLINDNKNILSKGNIDQLEKLLKTELENAINFYIINYDINNEN